MTIPNGATPMHFYTTQKISGKRSKTPEGFLLIEDVPLARVGRMIYGPGETPVPPGPDGLVHIDRNEDEVFKPMTVASANGKDLCDDHPPEDVRPENWRDLSHGVILHPRRGAGVMDDFLVGDVLVKSKEGIELVESGKVELSMGYDAGYVVTAPGRGYQKDIIYNHVALVDKGRCGPRCSIGDRQYIQEKPMTTARTADRGKPKGILARARDQLLAAVRSGKTVDEEMLEETLGDSESEEVATGHVVNIHNHPAPAAPVGDKDMTEEEKEKKTEDRIRDAVVKGVSDAMGATFDAIDKRFKDLEAKIGKGKDKDDEEDDKETKDNEKILGALELEAPPGTNDKESFKKVKDSAFLDHAFRETLALAEVLAPGIRAPTFDRAASPQAGLDTICNLRRTALDAAYHRDIQIRQLVDGMGASGFKTMDCAGVKPAFVAAAQLKKSLNNSADGATSGRTQDFARRPGNGVGGAKMTIREINERNKAHYSKKTG